jgi:uncharacterized protein YbjQ (UPF0145 family)
VSHLRCVVEFAEFITGSAKKTGTRKDCQVELGGRAYCKLGKSQMKVTTLESVAGCSVEETLGVVRGTSMWSHRISKNSYGGLRGLSYTGSADMDQGLTTGREKAEASMQAQAKAMGANAIIGMRIEIVDLGSGSYAMTATGTAVMTQRLPMATPAFQMAANDDDAVVLPFMMAANSYQGSSLRH